MLRPSDGGGGRDLDGFRVVVSFQTIVKAGHREGSSRSPNYHHSEEATPAEQPRTWCSPEARIKEPSACRGAAAVSRAAEARAVIKARRFWSTPPGPCGTAGRGSGPAGTVVPSAQGARPGVAGTRADARQDRALGGSRKIKLSVALPPSTRRSFLHAATRRRSLEIAPGAEDPVAAAPQSAGRLDPRRCQPRRPRRAPHAEARRELKILGSACHGAAGAMPLQSRYQRLQLPWPQWLPEEGGGCGGRIGIWPVESPGVTRRRAWARTSIEEQPVAGRGSEQGLS